MFTIIFLLFVFTHPNNLLFNNNKQYIISIINNISTKTYGIAN